MTPVSHSVTTFKPLLTVTGARVKRAGVAIKVPFVRRQFEPSQRPTVVFMSKELYPHKKLSPGWSYEEIQE